MNNLIVISVGSTELLLHKNLKYNYACNMSKKNWPSSRTAALHKITSHWDTQLLTEIVQSVQWLSCRLSYSAVCLTTGPKPLPKRFLHIVRSKASSFKWQYPLLSLRSSSSFLHLLPRLLVTSISPFIFPSITCFIRQFLRKMWPIQLAFRFIIM